MSKKAAKPIKAKTQVARRASKKTRRYQSAN